MSNDLIAKICDPQNEDRDLLVDELNDEIEAGSYNEEKTRSIILKLLDILPFETELSVCESILNLLSGLYPSGNSTGEIEKYILAHINSMKPGSLIHALSILSESKLEERFKYFFTYSESNNEVIKTVAKQYLSMM